MQKKKIKTYLIFVFILFIFVLYFSLKDNYVAILDTLSNVNIIYLILGIIFVFLSKCLIGVIVYNFAKREKKDIKLGRIIHIELVYPFFAGITPGSLGGESFEILFLLNINNLCDCRCEQYARGKFKDEIPDNEHNYKIRKASLYSEKLGHITLEEYD